MSFKSDIEIAQAAAMRPIKEIAASIGIDGRFVENYGEYKAKIDLSVFDELAEKPDGKLILVTAINPTVAGEGKTTTTVGLADALRKIGKKPAVALREPSLGPVFGVKGGAAGGGRAQVVPMEDINLHFTGDFHAVGAANNLLAAMLDNHIFHGNALGIDRVVWKRAADMNDRQLRSIVCGLGGASNGSPREEGFDITAASEVMAILCLAADISDLKGRLSRVIAGYTREGAPVTAGMLKAHGAMTALLKDALKPNLVQTLEGVPALIHGGPFANIAHGCNSVIATRLAMKLGDYAVTEAGFGADLGAEKFIDIKCRIAGLKPSAAIVTATARALKRHGGAAKNELDKENLTAIENGFSNLRRHVENITNIFGLPAVVAINKFPFDTDDEINLIKLNCQNMGVRCEVSEVWAKGGDGGVELARAAIDVCNEPDGFRQCYSTKSTIKEKLNAIVRNVYGGDCAELTVTAEKQAEILEKQGFGELPVCVAKTQYSFSDDASLLGAPESFKITVRDMKVAAGAGFIVALTGNIMTMPGLTKTPAAEKIDVDGLGKISGLF
ncbi:MAG: formate--tetrahydrofolate ligase [Clostridiales bacterium]|nr:formate--tetrahydrofolate ligase [Clostridiales bacterium]